MSDSLTCTKCALLLGEPQNFCPRCGADLRGLGSANDTLSGPFVGRLIDARYRILEKLGEGGMGAVFRVEHVRMGKVLALKLLRKELAEDRAVVHRFEQEARIVSKLSHPNTVSVFDFGETEDKTLFMAMEYVPGKDLGTVLTVEGALPEKRVVGIAIQVLHSLAEAHDAGIVHRDVKPANIMLLKTREGGDFVKVLDFGIARLARRDDEKGKVITGLTDFVGTPNYIPPEQARGEVPDSRSDLYSLGAMLFELTTGRPPFDGPNPMAVVAKHLENAAPRVKDVAPDKLVSPAFDEIVGKSLSKARGERWQNADEMRGAFEALARRYSEPLLPSGSLESAITLDAALARREDFDAFERQLRQRPWRFFLAAAISVAILAGTGTYFYRHAIHALPLTLAPVADEKEPNDTFLTANPIRVGGEVHGTIGKRLSDTASDQDHFEFLVEGDHPRAARITVTGVPNVNIVLELFAVLDRAGRTDFKQIAKVDDQPVGAGPEVMDDLRLEPGRYVVRVRDGRRVSEGPGAPRENSYDRYALTVDLEEPGPFDEIEPNNTPDDLIRIKRRPLDTSQPVLGHTGLHAPRETVNDVSAPLWSDDYHAFVLPPGASHACVLLRGVPGTTLRLSVPVADGAAFSATQIRPVSVPPDSVGSKCVPAQLSLLVRVDLESGGQDKVRYALAVVDDSPGGFIGAIAAHDALVASGQAKAAHDVLSRAIELLSKAPGVTEARRILERH